MVVHSSYEEGSFNRRGMGAVLDTQKTIQFCGDSFCESTKDGSYLTILSNKLNTKIECVGVAGAAYEHAIQSFNPNIDYTVFCWTEPQRLYHPIYAINYATAKARQDEHIRHKAAHLYYEHVHNTTWFTDRQFRDLYWFDKEVLSKSNSKIIHCFGFENSYSFDNGYTMSKPIRQVFRIGLNMSVASGEQKGYYNHLTIEHNKLFADYLYKKFTDKLLFA